MGVLDGKVAIVTGGSRGIGRGIALTFAKEGAKVVVASRTQSSVDATVKQIKDEGGTATGVSCNVGSRDQVFRMVERTVDTYGTVDILVNNAQSFGTEKNPRAEWRLQPLEIYDEDDWEWTFRTGLLSTLWGMKAVFPHMKEHGGKIINFCSYAGMIGWSGAAAYNAAKEGVRALTRTGAREWGKYSINVNVVAPAVRSDAMIEQERSAAGREILATQLKSVPMGRYGDPVRDAGPLAVFLASPASDYLTGMTFLLDGGLGMMP